MDRQQTIRNPMVFAPRHVRAWGAVQGDWTAKLYAIFSDTWSEADLPPPAKVEDAVRQAMKSLDGPVDHPAGFAILHFADDGVYLLLTRFSNANNLRHRVFAVTWDKGELRLGAMSDPQIIACVWELRLMMFEADMWIDAVLRAGEGLTPSAMEQYLARRFEGTV